MTLTELYNVLSSTGLPVAYSAFRDDEKVVPPCITYEAAYSTNFGADNQVYSPFVHVDIFLFQKVKGNAESSLESALNANKLFWDKTETFNKDEEVFQTIYEVKINA